MAILFTFEITDLNTADLPQLQQLSPDAENAATAIRDLAADPLDGELVIGEGDLVFNFGPEAVASEIKSFCLTFGPGTTEDGEFIEGEWFLDTSIGVNFWGAVFRGASNQMSARAAFSGQCALVPGVLEVRNIVSDLTDRGFTLSFDALINLGKVISATLSETTDGE